MVSTGSNRSPSSATRASTSAASKRSAELAVGARLDLVPRHRRRHRRLRAGPQRVRGDRRLVVGVLAPVDEDLPRPHGLGHHGGDLLGQLLLQHLADGEGELGGLLVGHAGRVHRHVQLQALRARRLAPALEADRGEHLADAEGDAAALDDRRCSGRGRSRTPRRAAWRGRRPAPSARAARWPPCWRPTPAPPARRGGSTRCRPGGRPGPRATWTHSGRWTGSASRRSPWSRCRWGSA